eukprot:2136120-Pyramimonas_sp.AAC.1
MRSGRGSVPEIGMSVYCATVGARSSECTPAGDIAAAVSADRGGEGSRAARIATHAAQKFVGLTAPPSIERPHSPPTEIAPRPSPRRASRAPFLPVARPTREGA